MAENVYAANREADSNMTILFRYLRVAGTPLEILNFYVSHAIGQRVIVLRGEPRLEETGRFIAGGTLLNWNGISEIVNKALDLLIKEQPELLDLDVSERALSHHLAIYISREIPDGFNIDVEYNRHRGDPKRLTLAKRETTDRELQAITVFPDIIVHKRNSDEQNLLVLEMKKSYGDLDYDRAKLEAFKSELGYQYAAHVIIGRSGNGVVRGLIRI